MSKRLVVCTIRPSSQWLDVGSTRECLIAVSEALRTAVTKKCGAYSQEFSSGSQNHERMAFTLMTSLNDEKLYKLVNDACGKHYEVHILI